MNDFLGFHFQNGTKNNSLSQMSNEELVYLLKVEHVHCLKALRRKFNYLGLDDHLRERFNLRLSPQRTIPKLIQQLKDFDLVRELNHCSTCRGCVHQITKKGEEFLIFYAERDESYDLLGDSV